MISLPARLALSARLVLSCENDDFLANADDDTIVVDLSSWRAGLAVLRFDSARGGWGKLAAQAQRGIMGADLRV